MVTRRQLLALGLSVPLLSSCSKEAPLVGLHGIDMSSAKSGRDFDLMGADGKRYTLEDFEGKVVMLFFGFTQCPDICPTALFRAAEVKRSLGADGDRFQVLFVTVDPERDTPEILQAYTQAFDPSFLALYGSPEETDKTAREFRMFYHKVPAGDSYTIDHTALSYVYDRAGRLRVALRHDQPVSDYVDDVRKIMAV